MKAIDKITYKGYDAHAVNKKLKHKIANISLLITTLAETPLAIAYVFRINTPHMNIAAGIGIIFFLIFLWSGK